MGSAPRIAIVAFCSMLLASVLCAQESHESTAPPTPAQLAAMERVRPLVDAIWREVRTPSKPGEAHPRYFWEVTDKLIEIGPDVVPFLTSELELMDPATFHFSAYALGRLGGRDAEAALRKAIRAADAGGGRFGHACKRFALYGLALLGQPETLDLVQTGDVKMHDAQMIPDFLLVAHLALLIGPTATPLLVKQLDTFGSDPTAVARLEDALLALGYTGDASIVPRLIPFLASEYPKVRVQAAEAIARLGEPPFCEKLLPLLATTDLFERELVAKTFERWKPEPCYKAMVGRLEVEDDVEARGAIYKAIVVMGGESSLEVFRAYLNSSNQFDRAIVIESIGRIGSKKGLNMLRSLLTDKDTSVVVRALQSIAAIGGESATDTLFAATSDRRRTVAGTARELLTQLGVKKVAPRIAADLLATVREPVGNLSMRTPIARQAEALVTLGYTDPADDLKTAAAVQSIEEVAESLTSCARRLQLIAKNGDDAAAWAADTASPLADVRRLADRRLAEIGSPAAVRTLTARLAKTDLPPDERAWILLVIGDARTAGTAQLVERHLADPAYDTGDFHDARAAAAFAARRLGGDRMARALRESAVRRDGRDWETLVYLAVLEKGAAVPTLKTLRVRRLRYPEQAFGGEEKQIERILADIAAGRTLAGFDVPPAPLFPQ